MLLYVKDNITKLPEGSSYNRSHSIHSTVLSWFRLARRRIRLPPRPHSDTRNHWRPHTHTLGRIWRRVSARFTLQLHGQFPVNRYPAARCFKRTPPFGIVVHLPTRLPKEKNPATGLLLKARRLSSSFFTQNTQTCPTAFPKGGAHTRPSYTGRCKGLRLPQ